MINAKALDIETIPNMDLVAMLPEPEVALGNTKDPEKIKEKIAEAKQKQLDKMGLSPFFGRVCSFSLFGESQESRMFKTIQEISDSAEIELIKAIFKNLEIAQENPYVFITWNGFSFDFPFIYKRAALLNVEKPSNCPGLKYWSKKYSCDCHIDLMRELNNWEPHGAGALNLDTAGKLFLGQGKTKRDYLTYVDLIKEGKSDLIGLDNLCDTELTFNIYKKVEPYIF